LKNIILILLLSFNLNASTLKIEKEIYSLVLDGLFSKNIVKVWCDDKNKNLIFNNMKKVIIVNTKNEADILMIYNTYELETKKMIFVGKYRLLKEYKNNAIGGFYWQKGRPNLIILNKNLDYYKLKVSNELLDYVE
jgi:hypothetical protein